MNNDWIPVNGWKEIPEGQWLSFIPRKQMEK